MESNKLNYIIAIAFILIGFGFRLFPHLPNFNPITAIALFGGVYLTRRVAFIVPFVAMLISDYFIGYYEFTLMVSVYGSFVVCVLLGIWLKNNKKWYNILGSATLCSILFFFITNFSVWAFTIWYPHTLTGLIQCFGMALPFFRNALLGDIFYVSIFFGAYEMAKIAAKRFVFRKVQVSI